MISHDLKCIFIHINRNGGKSIESTIWNIKPVHGSADHKRIKQWQQNLDKNIFDNYFKFTFSRNPWDRTVSLYHYYKQTFESHKKYVTSEAVESFENFVNNLNSKTGNILAPSQLSWLKDLNDKVRIDFVGRFENYEGDWNVVCKKLKIVKKLPHLNKSKHKDYRSYYNRKLIEIVKKVYQEDIDFFKYNF